MKTALVYSVRGDTGKQSIIVFDFSSEYTRRVIHIFHLFAQGMIAEMLPALIWELQVNFSE